MSDGTDDESNRSEGTPSQPALEVPAPVRRRRGATEIEEEPEAARKRLLLVVPLVMAAGAIVGLVFLLMKDKGVYSKQVDELITQKEQFIGKPVRAEGMLVHGSLQKRDAPCEYRFRIAAKGVEVPVRYAGCVVPDTFKDVAGMDLAVTVEGELRKDSSIEASQILAKCPSKYEMQQKAAAGEKAPHPSPQF